MQALGINEKQMKQVSGIQTNEKSGEVPNFVIRLRKKKGEKDFMFYCEESPFFTTIVPGQATRYVSESIGRLKLADLKGHSIQAYELLIGAKVLPVVKMLDADEEKMIIKFHVASGKSYEEGEEIKEIVRVIIAGQYPNAEVVGDHWHAGVRNFCHIGNYKSIITPAQAASIEQRVMEIIKGVSEKVQHRHMEEVYDYA